MKVKTGSGNSRFVGAMRRVDRRADMRHYDRLPPVVRAALQSAISDSACRGLTGLARRYGPDLAAASIRAADRKESAQFVRAEFGAAALPFLCPQVKP